MQIPDYGQGEARSPLFYLLETAHIQNLFVPNDSKYPAITRFLLGTFHVNFICTLNAVGWTNLILQAALSNGAYFTPIGIGAYTPSNSGFTVPLKGEERSSTGAQHTLVASFLEGKRAPQSWQVNKKNKKREGLNKKCLS